MKNTPQKLEILNHFLNFARGASEDAVPRASKVSEIFERSETNQLMTLQFDSAVSALEKGGEVRGSGERLKNRLQDVQTFLGRDLLLIEETLAAGVSDGPEPAVSAAKHLVMRGGKRVRPLALLLAAKCFGSVEGESFYEMAAVVELVHSATLLHDDVIDEGDERRGAPTSRKLHGNGVSVLSGDLLLVNALDRTRRAEPRLLGELIHTLRRLVDGEIVQLRGRTELDVSEETYEAILKDKTASLFAFAASAGGLMNGASEEQQRALSDFGEALGIAFQLVDDVIDYEGEETGKTLYADLLEGKLTLPLVLAIQKDPSLESLVAKIHSGDESVVAEVSRRVIQSGSCDEVRARAKDFTKRAVDSLDALPACPAREFLRVVAFEMTGRKA